MPSQGPNFPTAAGTDGTGTDWSNPSRITADDGSAATCALVVLTSSSLLYGTGFGFTIPGSAKIDGLVLEVKKADVLGIMLDAWVGVFANGAQGTSYSDDKSDGIRWPASLAYSTYGSTTDLWGQTWQASMVNNAGFGAEIGCTDDTGAATAQVDAMRVTAYFTPKNAGMMTMMGVGCIAIAGFLWAGGDRLLAGLALMAGVAYWNTGRSRKQTRNAQRLVRA